MGLSLFVRKIVRSTVAVDHRGAHDARVAPQLGNAEFSLTAQDVQRLVAAGSPPRDQALLRLLVETGVRRSEAAGVRAGDVDWEKRLLVVQRGKGGKQRVVPITPELAAALRSLAGPAEEGYVFRSRQGDSLSPRQINRIVADAGRQAGVAHPNPRYRQITCHLLRHTFARLWKAEGGSIESLSNILGHSSVKTTWDVYGTESLDDVQRNYAQTIRSIFGSEDTP
jgi:integrase